MGFGQSPGPLGRCYDATALRSADVAQKGQTHVWSNPLTNTPSIIQYQFGAWGQYMPGDGEMYCAPTSLVMGLHWLYANGFTQLEPAPFSNQDDPDTVNLERVIVGLVNTSSKAGTTRTAPASTSTGRLW